MEFIDTHCHLTLPPLLDHTDDVLCRATDAGVTAIIAPAWDAASIPLVEGLLGRPGIYGALGRHPWKADEPFDADDLRRRLSHPRIAAVGEIGLDFKVPVDKARQLAVLETQLDMAVAAELPVLLHCRGAFAELQQLLDARRGALRGVIHAFSRGPELAMAFVERGFHIAFGGAVTRPDADRARRAAAVVPTERLLLETDAPSIGLHGIAPEKVEPAHVRDVAQALADIRNCSIEDIARQTTTNARALFRLPP